MIKMYYNKKEVCAVPIKGLTMDQLFTSKEIIADKLGIRPIDIELKYTPVGGERRNHGA